MWFLTSWFIFVVWFVHKSWSVWMMNLYISCLICIQNVYIKMHRNFCIISKYCLIVIYCLICNIRTDLYAWYICICLALHVYIIHIWKCTKLLHEMYILPDLYLILDHLIYKSCLWLSCFFKQDQKQIYLISFTVFQ